MTTHRRGLSSLVVLLVVFLGATAGPTSAGDLRGRVVIPAGSGPAVVFVRGLTGQPLPAGDTIITHRVGGTFEPPVAIGFVGNDLVFKNEDDQLHTTHLYLHLAQQERVSGRPLKNGATLYNIALPQPGMEVRRPIKAYFEYSDDTGVIDVRCNPHPGEQAALLVFDHPYAAVTATDGSFSIAGVPAGTHEVWVWHAGRIAKWRDVAVKASGATDVTGAISLP